MKCNYCLTDKRIIAYFGSIEEPLQIYFQNRLEKLTLLNQKTINSEPSKLDESMVKTGEAELKPLNRDRIISFDVDEVVDNLAQATNLRRSAMYKSYSGEGVSNALRAQKSLTNVRMSWEPKGGILPLKVSNMDSYRRLRMQRVREYSMNKKLSEEMKRSRLQGSEMAKFKETDRVNDEQIHDNLRFQKNNIRERLKVRRDKSISKRVERSKSSFDINLRRGLKMERKVKERKISSGKVPKSMVEKAGKRGYFLEGEKSLEVCEKAMFPSGLKYASEADKLKDFLFDQNPENEKLYVDLKKERKMGLKRKTMEKKGVEKRRDGETMVERVKSVSTTSRGRWSQERVHVEGMQKRGGKLVGSVVERLEDVKEGVEVGKKMETVVKLKKEEEASKREVAKLEERVNSLKAAKTETRKMAFDEDLIGDLKMQIIRKDTEEMVNQDAEALQELDIYESKVIVSHKIVEPENVNEEVLKNEDLPLVSARVPEIKASSIKELKRMEFEMKKKKRKRGNMWVPNSACKYEELKRSLFNSGSKQKCGGVGTVGSGSKKTSSRYGKVVLSGMDRGYRCDLGWRWSDAGGRYWQIISRY